MHTNIHHWDSHKSCHLRIYHLYQSLDKSTVFSYSYFNLEISELYVRSEIIEVPAAMVT